MAEAGVTREGVTREGTVRLPANPERDPSWTLVEEGFVLTREHEIESLFAIGNGLVGSRGALAEGTPLSAPATFVAGVFERSRSSMPVLLRAPPWAEVSATINGQPLSLCKNTEQQEHRRILDMRQGILWREWRVHDSEGRVTHIRGMRLASLADRHLLLQSVTLTPENYSGPLTIEVPARSRSAPLRTESGVVVDLVARSRVWLPDKGWVQPTAADEHAGGHERWTLEVELGKTYRFDRVACVYVWRDAAPVKGLAEQRVEAVLGAGIEDAVQAHVTAWRERWDASDVVIEGDERAQHAVRFAAYHLISAANPEDERVSIGARALTGAAYEGHVFWDTEIYMLPFFTLTYPEAARALLMYRYHTLPAACARAAQAGYRGALYAWESADTGEDVTPTAVVAPSGEVVRIHVGEQEHHISADVAYGVWSYWHATGDDRFLVDAGAEILFETARFWASRARREADGLWHIRRVIGPDEYHEAVDDNAYTNGMARWNLETAFEIAGLVRDRFPDRFRALAERLNLDVGELHDWQRVARGLYTGFDPKTGLFEQFRGYFELEDIDLSEYAPRTAPMDVVLGRERIQNSQIIKQPDVLMLLYLLRDRFPASVREANFRYYEPRTGHGSSLSPSIHAAFAAQLGDMRCAEHYFRMSAEIDLADGMGNAASGVHAAALGGLWQAIVFGFAGVDLSGDRPRSHPRLPSAWHRLRFTIQWRGERFPFDLSAKAPVPKPVLEVQP